MKIVIVNMHMQDNLGGSEVLCDLIARELTERGHEVIYLAPRGKGPYDTDYRVVPVEQDGEKIGEAATGLDPDVVYWRFNKHGFRKAAAAIHRHGIPLVFAVSHINDFEKWHAKAVSKKKNPVKRWLIYLYLVAMNRREYTGFRWVDGVVVNNREFLNRLPVDRQLYVPSSIENRARDFRWPRPFVLWVSSLKPSKRPELCLDLAREIGSDGVDVLMLGEIQKEEYRWFEKQENLPSNLHYLGKKPIELVNGALAESLCLVHTCEPEGYPVIFTQAWRQGKPVVSFVYDPDGVIRENGLGFVCGGDMETFAGDVRKLIHNKELAQQIALRAETFAGENFSAAKNMKKLERFLVETAGAAG